MRKIFVVEDDESIRGIVLYALETSGFCAVGFESGSEFFAELDKTDEPPDLLLLDIMLPGEDGLTILKKIRANPRFGYLPVIMTTAKGSEYDKVKGLDLGADDYVTKPFGVMELISRINAVLRRSFATSVRTEDKLTYKNLVMDNVKHTVYVEDEKISLTYKEYQLLNYLLLNIDIVVSREKILQAVWGYDFEGESRTINMHIKTLRQKLNSAGEYIKTIRNVGYKIGE